MSNKPTNTAYIFDTNAVITWLYYNDDKKRKLAESIDKLNNCYILVYTIEEVLGIISDSYKLFSHIIICEVLRNDSWDSLKISDRLRIIEGIEKDFEEHYERIWETYYKDSIPHGHIRVYISKLFFKAYKERILRYKR
ncbi:hypothetical protein [Sulfuracidifex tepidarius]|nr:hypothetical protein [Sulfuracidifex tepidarius]